MNNEQLIMNNEDSSEKNKELMMIKTSSQNQTNSFFILHSLFFILYFLFFIVHCNAQVVLPAEKQYQAATQLVRIGDYERAKTDLNIIIQHGGSFAPYATYYYALATYRQKNWPLTRLMLKQLMSQYPDWKRHDDAYYLYAAVCFESALYVEGFQYVGRISDPELRDDIDKLERFFLPKITDLTHLKTINRDAPDNRNVGLRLMDRIQQSSTDRADLELSDELTNRFGIPTTPVNKPVAATTTTPVGRYVRNPAKGYWNVAALLPFRIDEFGQNQRGRTNQFVYDWYAGLKMAQAKLQTEGITVNLFAYDIDNDLAKARELINNEAFLQNDLVIGPLYAEPNRVVTAFAKQQNMVIVNPIATNADLLVNQPLAFLVQPSVMQQAKKGVAFMRDLGGPRQAAVYFGTARKDSVLAIAYQTELKRQGIQVVDFLKVTGKSSEMATALKPKIANRPGHIFYATSSEADGSHLLDALSRLGLNVPVLVTSTGFDYYQASLSTFTRRDLYLLYPDFMDTDRPSVEQFRDAFLAQWHIIPSVFAAQGYDTLLFFGRQLARTGLPLRNIRSDTDDYVLSGFNYTQSNDNQSVPIVKFEGSKFKLVAE